MNEKIQTIKTLVSELNQYRHEYYNLARPSVSDAVYDAKFDKLKKLEDETGYILVNSPTQSVGYDVVSNLSKVTHATQLKSLDKTKSIDDINKWRKGQTLLLMLKLDGLTIELDYQNGKLVEASTRGNGEVGELVTHTVKTFKNVPKTIPYKGKLRISGEAIIHWNSFKIINQNLPQDEQYKHPRNLASGSVRQLDPKICASREVCFYAFNVLECSDTIDGIADSKRNWLNWLAMLGFDVVQNLPFNVDLTVKTVETIREMASQHQLPIDGLVFAYDSIEYANKCGETSHHPLHSMAFKFEDETAITKLKEIEWSVGRTGVITPVAIFETVDLDGTEVSRASLHNLTILKNLKLGIGDEIVVYKANMIIPQVLTNNTESNNIVIPDKCPVCGGHAEQVTQKDSTVLMCTNQHCPSQLLARFAHFVSRDAMNIDGLSESTLEKFINKGFIKRFIDIYNLKIHAWEIEDMEGFGKRSVEKLMHSIDKSKNVKMWNFIYALGIPNIGKSSAKTIAEYFDNDIVAFYGALHDGFDFTQLKDFGQVTHDALYTWNKDPYENALSGALGTVIKIDKPQKKQQVVTDSIFCGKKVYATGSFANYKKEEIVTLLESLGAVYMSGYAKSLDYLIVGSLKGSGKEDKAKKDGIKILTEDEFRSMIK
jgi:DNA ligase (NAD+)